MEVNKMTENNELIKVEEKQDWEEALEKENLISPLVNVFETEDDFILSANLPGVERKNIKLKLEGQNLIIIGKIDYQSKINRNYILQESEIGNYYRSFKIADTIDTSKIEAKYDNGQLLIKLAKSEKIKPKTIKIK